MSKRYGQVVACDGVDLAVRRGEIHGLLGENGAGKSTLMKVLTGLVRPDSGVILRDGSPVDVADPQVAATIGVGMVHQHFSLVGALTVWENVLLADAAAAPGPSAGGWRGVPGRRRSVVSRLRREEVCEDVVRVGERYGIAVDPLAVVDSLSAGQRQRVEIIKCLRRDPDVLILDEPTSVLSLAESRELFSVLRRAVTDGPDGAAKAVVLISHKLTEILTATDRVTVLRRGRVVARQPTAATDAATLAREMVGRTVALAEEAAALGLAPAAPAAADCGAEPAAVAAAAPDGGQPARVPALAIDAVTLTSPTGARLLDSFSLAVHAGEIVGLYGVEGNGQPALGDLLSGLVTPDRGRVLVKDAPVDLRRPGALHAAGVGVVPEDRHRSGCVLDMSVADNLVLTDLGPVSGRLFVSRRRQLRRAAELAERFGISCPSLDAPLRTLSGGNQQRVVLARELSADPAVLVAAQPTRGLDVGAIEDMYRELRAVAARGVAVLLISTELEEVMALSDRIAVISSGRVVGELAPAEADAERLGLLVGGAAEGGGADRDARPAHGRAAVPAPSTGTGGGSARPAGLAPTTTPATAAGGGQL
ncbi:MAG: ABC transporter ATP-binding protein [Frankia sp.]|nr:ABC transporter ATP-binding protein [Frankia sp.]